MNNDSETNWGLAALGVSGRIEISVDEACSEIDRWQLSVEQDDIYIRFEISSTQTVYDLLSFLRCHLHQKSEDKIVLGVIGNAEVSLIKDDEFADRFWWAVAAQSGIVRYQLATEELDDYIAALQSVIAELCDES